MAKWLKSQRLSPLREVLRIRLSGRGIERLVVKQDRLQRALDDIPGMVRDTIQTAAGKQDNRIVEMLPGGLRMVVVAIG